MQDRLGSDRIGYLVIRAFSNINTIHLLHIDTNQDQDTIAAIGQWYNNWLNVSSPLRAPHTVLACNTADPVFTDKLSERSNTASKNSNDIRYTMSALINERCL